MAFYLWDQSVEFLQDVPTPASSPFFFHVGNIAGIDAKQRLIVSGGQTVEQGDGQALRPVECCAFNKGDYMGFLKNPFGSLAVYSLTDGLVLERRRREFQRGRQADRAGDESGHEVASAAAVGGNAPPSGGPRRAGGQDRADYGIGAAPSYSVKAQVGRVRGSAIRP